MELLYVLEGIRTPAGDAFFSLITHLGSEFVFMLLAVVLYWCVSKAEGMYLLGVGCLGTTINQFLKITCRVPRPWVRDPNFTIVESARADAAGYSFPSGHTQSAFGTFGCLAMFTRRNWVRILCILPAVLVGLSRMYLGVHTLADVGVSVIIAVGLVFGLRPLFRGLDQKPEKGIYPLLGLALINLAFMLYVALWPFPPETDQALLRHSLGQSGKLVGAILGMAAGYVIDLKKIRFRPQAPLPAQILKVVLGAVLMLAIKEGLKPLLGTSMIASMIRYFFITLFAAGLWPAVFPKLETLAAKLPNSSGKKAQS